MEATAALPRMSICENRTMTWHSGRIVSEHFPANYRNNQHCHSVISVDQALFIEVSFEVFHTQSVADLNLYNEMCDLDFLEIYDATQHWAICGNWAGREKLLYFTFNSSTVHLHFTSNSGSTRPGFSLSWASTVQQPDNATRSPCSDPLLETESACFELVHETADWPSSLEACRLRGATLAQVDHPDTHEALETKIRER